MGMHLTAINMNVFMLGVINCLGCLNLMESVSFFLFWLACNDWGERYNIDLELQHI